MPAIEADALVTDQPGIALGVLAADCAPVLLADPLAGVIGAAHAGWRGAFDNILKSCVETMVEIGAAPARIRAVVGPAVRSMRLGRFCGRFCQALSDRYRPFHAGYQRGARLFQPAGFRTAPTRALRRCGSNAGYLHLRARSFSLSARNPSWRTRLWPSDICHRTTTDWIDVPAHKQRGKPKTKIATSSGFAIRYRNIHG